MFFVLLSVYFGHFIGIINSIGIGIDLTQSIPQLIHSRDDSQDIGDFKQVQFKMSPPGAHSNSDLLLNDRC